MSGTAPKGEKFITTLMRERGDLEMQLRMANARITEMMAYFASSKFQGTDNDYAHVSTDIMPKLMELRSATLIND